ncbi:hypothetical protein [Lentzea sp. NEAU-D7]|uniref:hypothetical protein n=1 Tax=Lentzea sp. NEAU-D7 TaxID=2994667 RepID=UPI00224B8292|nr:hypothetical protein [Lentzea sp. NEAU-D7]MCX2947064.1 hypothetical protein [Lentzea sp. NEAU-D7]
MRARVVQVVAILAGAAFTFLAGWKYSDASSAWQEAIRVEVDRAGVRQDEVRRVYANEGPFAFRVAALQIRAEALAPLEGVNPSAAAERTIAENAAFSLRQASGPTTLLGQRRYDLPGGGSDLVHRLADVAAQRAKPLPDPEVSDRRGDDFARFARWISVITVLVTGLAVAGASLRGSARSQEVELFAQPGAADEPERRFAYLALAVWAAGILFPLVQLTFSSQEQRLQAEAARYAVQARSAESISTTRTEFVNTARQIAREGDVAATGREIDAAYADARTAAAARELARAEEGAAARSDGVAVAMARAPAPADGIEAGLAAALVSGQRDWDSLAQQSARATKDADVAGIVSNTMLGVIGLVVLAEARVEVTAAGRRRAQTERPDQRTARPRSDRTIGLVCLALVLAVVLRLVSRRSAGRE